MGRAQNDILNFFCGWIVLLVTDKHCRMRTFSEEREVHMNGLWGFAVHDSQKPSVIFAPCEGSNFADFRYRQHNGLVPCAGNALEQTTAGAFNDVLRCGTE